MKTLACDWNVGWPVRTALREIFVNKFGFKITGDDGLTPTIGSLIVTQDVDTDRNSYAISVCLQLRGMKRPALKTISASGEMGELSQKVRTVLPEFLYGLGLTAVEDEGFSFYVFIERDEDGCLIDGNVFQTTLEEANQLAGSGGMDLALTEIIPAKSVEAAKALLAELFN